MDKTGRIHKTLKPTELGIALIEGFRAIQKNFIDPDIRHLLENCLKAIAEAGSQVDPIEVCILNFIILVT